MTTINLVGSCVLISGIIPIKIGFIWFRKKKNRMAGAIRVQGRVTNFKKSNQTVFVGSPGDSGTPFRDEENLFEGEMVAPIISYETMEGETHTVTGIYSNKPSLKMGMTVDILYLQNSPEKAIIDRFVDKWLVVVLLVGIGGILTISGILMLAIPKLVH